MRKIKHEKGQTMVEFAIAAPILFFILFAIMDIGWLVANKNELVNQSAEVSRYVAITLNNETSIPTTLYSDTQAYVEKHSLFCKNVKVTSIKITNSTVSVELSDDMNYLTGLPGCFTGTNTVHLVSTSAMPLANTLNLSTPVDLA